MSVNYNAQQYEKAFAARRLQNYERLRLDQSSTSPSSRLGYTRPIVDHRGHICHGQQKSRASPWGSYIGTWDMPRHIPGNHVTAPTGRRHEEVCRAQLYQQEFAEIMAGGRKPRRSLSPLPVLYDNHDGERVVGMVCEPKFSGGQGQGQTVDEAPCMMAERLHSESHWPRALSRMSTQENTKFPKIKAPQCPPSPPETVPVMPGIGDIDQILAADVDFVNSRRG